MAKPEPSRGLGACPQKYFSSWVSEVAFPAFGEPFLTTRLRQHVFDNTFGYLYFMKMFCKHFKKQMKTTTSRATRAVLSERAIVAQWRGTPNPPPPPPPKSAPAFIIKLPLPILLLLPSN